MCFPYIKIAVIGKILLVSIQNLYDLPSRGLLVKLWFRKNQKVDRNRKDFHTLSPETEFTTEREKEIATKLVAAATKSLDSMQL